MKLHRLMTGLEASAQPMGRAQISHLSRAHRLTVCLITALVLAASPALAEAPTTAVSDFLPGIVDSADLDSPVVVRGRVLGNEDKAAPHIALALYAWPPSHVMSSMNVGDTFRVAAVGKATTDAQGNFALRISDEVNISEYVGNDTGAVDFEIVTYDEITDAAAAFSFPLELSMQAGRRSWSALGAEPTERFDAPQVTLNLSSELGIREDPNTATSDIQATVDTFPKACLYQLESLYSPQWDLVGTAYIDTSGVSATFTYSSGATSTLGVAYSANGGYGTFTSSGTTSKASTATIGFPVLSGQGRRYFDSQFQYGKYRRLIDSSCGLSQTYAARVYTFVGGARTRTPASSPSATSCASYQAGASHIQNTTNASTFSNGMSMSTQIGINLSTTTGYSSSASLRFDFTVTRRLCGTSGFPGSDGPGQLVAKL